MRMALHFWEGMNNLFLTKFLISMKNTVQRQQSMSWSGWIPVFASKVYRQNLKNGFLTVIRFEVRRGKQTKNGINVWFLSTGLSKSGPRGLESRQKTEEMSHFCLLDSPNPVRAVSKADKKRRKCLIFVYWILQIRSARSRKHNKIIQNRKNILLGSLRQNSVDSDYGHISEIVILLAA